MRFSDAQLSVMEHGFRPEKLLIAAGATRAGKSFSAAWGHAAWLWDRGWGKLHLVAGRTQANAWANVGEPLRDALVAMGATVTDAWRSGEIDVLRGRDKLRVRIMGAADATARGRVQGLGLGSMHLDELPLLDPSFWPMAWSRLDQPGTKCWCSLNPEGPKHYVKRTIIDRIEDYNGRVVEFSMGDNPTLAPETAASIRAGLHGHEYQRLVLGQWAAASGLVFPRWATCGAADVPEVPAWAVGYDWASASVSGAVLAACSAAEGRWPQRAVLVAELRHDARTEGVLTDEQHFEQFDRWVRAHTGGAERASVRVYVDPATHAGFVRLLVDAGYWAHPGENDVLEGIATTDARLSAGNVKLLEGACPHLEAELASYHWDERAAERGEDRPTKAADHLCDALRYWAHTSSWG